MHMSKNTIIDYKFQKNYFKASINKLVTFGTGIL